VQIGSARGYRVSSAPLAVPATAGQSLATAHVYASDQQGANILSCRRQALLGDLADERSPVDPGLGPAGGVGVVPARGTAVR
jgi:hypothetical protein